MAEEKEKKKGFFARLREGLSRTRDGVISGMDRLFSGTAQIDGDFYEELEEIMITGDIGVSATDEIMTKLKKQVREQHIKDPAQCRELLIQNIREQMHVGEDAYDFEKGPSVVLIIGVNGVGKTTSVAKLASIYKADGRKVLIAAADTFRAAAKDQGSRSGQCCLRRGDGGESPSHGRSSD